MTHSSYGFSRGGPYKQKKVCCWSNDRPISKQPNDFIRTNADQDKPKLIEIMSH